MAYFFFFYPGLPFKRIWNGCFGKCTLHSLLQAFSPWAGCSAQQVLGSGQYLSYQNLDAVPWCLELSATKWCWRNCVYFDRFSTPMPQPLHGGQIALAESGGWSPWTVFVVWLLWWSSAFCETPISRETGPLVAILPFAMVLTQCGVYLRDGLLTGWIRL